MGLISASDYINENSNIETCGTFSKNDSNSSTCITTNWMYMSGTDWWTLSPDAGRSDFVWKVSRDGTLSGENALITLGFSPTLYLTSSLSLSGSGTQSDPFTIVS